MSKYEKAKAAMRKYPGYLQNGAGKLAARFKLSVEDIKEIKKCIRAEQAGTVENKSTSEGADNFDPNSKDNVYLEFLQERGISQEDIVSVKHWQNMKGEPRFSVVTKNEREEVDFKREFFNEMLQEIRQETLTPFTQPPVDVPKSGNLAVMQIPDLHLGKIAKNWSLEEAEYKILETYEFLISYAKLFNIERFVLPIGHDLLQVDREVVSRSGTLHTTTSGTPVEQSDSWFKQFKAGRRLGTNLIRRTLQEAPVDVIVIPGNHAEHSEIALGEVWDATFANHPNVTIQNDGERLASFIWGKVGVLLTHGDTSSWEGLPLLFATAYPVLWGMTKYREVLTGHRHISKGRWIGDYEEMQGVMCRISPSLSPQDKWHRKYGYSSIPGAEVFIYNKEDGLIGHTTKRILC
jgi:hypothetical protein